MSEKTPLVGIIINCYNGEKYLAEAINSIQFMHKLIKIGKLFFGTMHQSIIAPILQNLMTKNLNIIDQSQLRLSVRRDLKL